MSVLSITMIIRYSCTCGWTHDMEEHDHVGVIRQHLSEHPQDTSHEVTQQSIWRWQ